MTKKIQVASSTINAQEHGINLTRQNAPLHLPRRHPYERHHSKDDIVFYHWRQQRRRRDLLWSNLEPAIVAAPYKEVCGVWTCGMCCCGWVSGVSVWESGVWGKGVDHRLQVWCWRILRTSQPWRRGQTVGWLSLLPQGTPCTTSDGSH